MSRIIGFCMLGLLVVTPCVASIAVVYYAAITTGSSELSALTQALAPLIIIVYIITAFNLITKE